MKSAIQESRGTTAPSRVRPRIVTSAVARRLATLEDIRFGIRSHEALDRLPFGFQGQRGEKFMIATAEDCSVTLMASVREFGDFTKSCRLRELTEGNVHGRAA